MANEHWVVSSEYDEKSFHRLEALLRRMGFNPSVQWNGVAGSQDISHWEFTSISGALVVESETYVGLSVEGPAELVHRIREQFKNGR